MQSITTRVFLCHAGEQKRGYVAELHQSFKREHPEIFDSVFMDELSIQPGQPGWDTILRALDDAAVVILVISWDFVAKKHPMEELCKAWERRDKRPGTITILPVLYNMTYEEASDVVRQYKEGKWEHEGVAGKEQPSTEQLTQWADHLDKVLGLRCIRRDEFQLDWMMNEHIVKKTVENLRNRNLMTMRGMAVGGRVARVRRSLGFYYVYSVHGKYMTAMHEISDVWGVFGLSDRWVVHCNDAERHWGHHNWKVWELFEIDHDDKRVAFRSCHDRWLSARDHGAVTNEADRLDQWETFELITVDASNHKFALRSCHDNKILKAYPDGRLRVESHYSNHELNGSHWESLTLEPVQAINTTLDAALGGGHLTQRFTAYQAQNSAGRGQDALQEAIASGGADIVENVLNYFMS